MSRCHFPHENRTLILDVPTLSHIHSTMLLIQTNNNISFVSTLSLSCFQRQLQEQQVINQEQDSLELLIGEQQQGMQELWQSNRKSKYSKGGCTCKKTNCLKMYCQCFSTGKMCTPQCACYGCYNQEGHEGQIQLAKDQLKLKASATNRHTDRACNCKKSRCQKKYCQCFNAGLPCTQACNCSDCCNREGCQGHSKQISNDIDSYSQSDDC